MSLNEPLVGMEEAEIASTTMGPPKTVPASKNQRKGHRSSKGGTATGKRIEAERAALVKKRQSDLEVVHDRHDTLVCLNLVILFRVFYSSSRSENFFTWRILSLWLDLTQRYVRCLVFTNISSFRAQEAKQDNTAVFREVFYSVVMSYFH